VEVGDTTVVPDDSAIVDCTNRYEKVLFDRQANQWPAIRAAVEGAVRKLV
jgi:hypothetical protein